MRFRLVATALAALALSAGTAAAQSGKLTLYTSQPNEDAAQTVEAFNERYPDVEVEIRRSGTAKVMSKLMKEISGGNPQPDVLLIATGLIYNTAAQHTPETGEDLTADWARAS